MLKVKSSYLAQLCDSVGEFEKNLFLNKICNVKVIADKHFSSLYIYLSFNYNKKIDSQIVLTFWVNIPICFGFI